MHVEVQPTRMSTNKHAKRWSGNATLPLLDFKGGNPLISHIRFTLRRENNSLKAFVAKADVKIQKTDSYDITKVTFCWCR